VNEARSVALAEIRRAWPYALVLAAALGAVVVAGADLSNAFPSKSRPFGWPGPSSFENAVAMVRPELVLAASLPALLLGATALARRDPRRDGAAALGIVVGLDAALLALATLVAALVGKWGSFATPADAFWAFAAAHALLALACYGFAFLASAIARGHAPALALAAWLGFTALYDDVTQTMLFRQAGYDRLVAGDFPPWFFVAQAFSPETLYRGVLILWDRKLMDYEEQAALANAALPAWLTPATFAGLLAATWFVVPIALGTGVWMLRRRRPTMLARVVFWRRAEPEP
jgi:hypothetical protein